MAQISKKDLEFLTSEQIKSFYKAENLTQFNISPIKEYIEKGKDDYTMSNRIYRVEKILNLIVVERFVKGIEECKPVKLHETKNWLQRFKLLPPVLFRLFTLKTK